MDDRAFSTWGRVLFGALGFAVLFGLVHVMAGLVIYREIVVGSATFLLAGVAFWGYVGVSTWIRRNPVSEDS